MPNEIRTCPGLRTASSYKNVIIHANTRFIYVPADKASQIKKQTRVSAHQAFPLNRGILHLSLGARIAQSV